ncbi:hypothetical protein [Pseudoalteromonas luteoviolacea]|nr:hypothetical protein [Pseudoalteromonas luteoviolacea]
MSLVQVCEELDFCLWRIMQLFVVPIDVTFIALKTLLLSDWAGVSKSNKIGETVALKSRSSSAIGV